MEKSTQESIRTRKSSANARVTHASLSVQFMTLTTILKILIIMYIKQNINLQNRLISVNIQKWSNYTRILKKNNFHNF